MNDSTPKSWYLSKTVWVNVLTLAVSVLGVFEASELLTERQLVLLAGLVIPIVNVILRWLTDRPISSFVKIATIERLRKRGS